jgi:hypothetical protein
MPLTTSFEKETCARCGGCGRYSYNEIDGDTCYGCGGHGERLTKRGAAAQAIFVDSLKVPLADLVVGDRIQIETLSRRYFAAITEIGQPEVRAWTCDPKTGERLVGHEMITVDTAHPHYGCSGVVAQADHRVRKAWPPEVKAAKLAEALAYQETLTKTGTVRVRA